MAGAHRDVLDAQADSLEKLGADKADPAALDTVARALKLPVGRTGPVQEGTKVQLGTFVVPDAGVWASTAKVGTTSPVIETPIAFYIFRLDSAQAAGVPPLGQIRQTVAYQARNDKKVEAARKLAREYEKQIDAGADLGAVAASMKLPYKEFGPFSRINPPLTDGVVVGTAFGLDVGQHSGMLDTNEGIYFIKVLERTKADSAAFAKEIDTYRPQMIRLAQQDRVRSYLEALRQSAKVGVDRQKVGPPQQAAPGPPGG